MGYPCECGNPCLLGFRQGRSVAWSTAREAGPTRRLSGGWSGLPGFKRRQIFALHLVDDDDQPTFWDAVSPTALTWIAHSTDSRADRWGTAMPQPPDANREKQPAGLSPC